MEKAIKVFALLLVIALAIASFVDRKIFNDDSEVKTLLEAKKVIINDADNKYIDSLAKTLKSSVKTSDEKLTKVFDELGLEDKKVKELKKMVERKNGDILDLSSKNLKALKDSKNKVVFEYESYKNVARPNFWLILLIIISAGIIGGWARMNYSLLLPLKNNFAVLEKKMEEILKKINAHKGTVITGNQEMMLANTVAEVQEDTKNLAEEIKNILDEIPDASQRQDTSIIFGIIASFISILALKLTDSQVLDFADTIDYFILSAWCLLGAVYAKDTLERVYNSRFTKTNS